MKTLLNSLNQTASAFKSILLALLLSLGVTNAWGEHRTFDGNTKFYIMNYKPAGWSDCWAKDNDRRIFVCLKKGESETWCEATLEAGSGSYSEGAIYSITPPADEYDYFIMTRAGAAGWDYTDNNKTGNIGFHSDASYNLVNGGYTSGGTGTTWGKIDPKPITSDGTGILYFKINPSSFSTWVSTISSTGDGNFAYFFNNSGGSAWAAHSVQKSGDYYYLIVPEGTWTGVILTRHSVNSNPSWDNKYNQTQDIPFVKGCNYLSNFGEAPGSHTWENYIPASTVLLNGSMNGWSLITAKPFSDGSLAMEFDAHSTYEFKVVEGGAGGSGTSYGLDNNVWTSSVANYGLYADQYQIRLGTAGAGEYTFSYNSSSHQLSVTYPEVAHPNIDYCYVINYNWSPSTNLHIWGSSSGVASTLSPGTQLHNTATINKESFFYIAPGDYANFLVSKNGDNTDRSGDLTTSEGYGKRRYYNGSTWVWDTFSVRIQLNDLSATTHVAPDYLDVAFNSDELTDLTTAPVKTNYDFGGFYTDYNDETEEVSGTQVIDASGQWIASVPDYTDASKHWIHAGTSTTLYAKWTETAYTITATANPAEGGSVNSVTDAHLTIPSSAITATPTNAAWVFSSWEYGEHVGPSTVSGNTVTVTSDMNSTITANFTHRYNLLGSKYEQGKDRAEMTSGGMPGWTYGSGADFTINSYTVDGDNATVNMSYTCNLDAGDYMFEIHDRKKGESLGRRGDESDIYVLEDGHNVQLKGGEDKDKSIFFYPQHAGQYTFRITYMEKDDDYYYPTVTIERPHAVYFGTGYAGIDDLSSVTGGTTGGSLEVTTSSGTLANGDYVTYGTNVTYTPSPETGYTFEGFYTSDEFTSRFTQDNPWIHYNLTGDDHVYAKFEEKSTSVTLSNDGHGHVEIGSGNTETSTTCGVTTTRELTAVPNEGYIFSSWNKSGDDIEITNTSTNPTTLTGNGAGETDGQEVRANFTYRYAIKGTMNGEDWKIDHLIANIGTNAGSKDTGYVDITLPANTTYEFAIYDKKTGVANPWLKNGTNEVFNMTYTNHTNWSFGTDKTSNCGITTAGKGTYKFIFNITDKTMTVVYPTSYQVNYGASVGGSVTSVKDDDNNDVPNGGYVRSGGNVTYTATPNDGYTFVGWCNDDSYGEPFTTYNPWPNYSVTATSNAYAKFKSTNFVIYRSGDMAEDDRAALDDVESYEGGTISETIEYRMKVHTLDQWTSLCLPFTVSAVKVWDEADGAYYDIVPFYRIGGKFYTGHYIIRTPETVTNYAIATFEENWQDPTSPDGYLPNANTPYIIQWHDDYFLNKYISFFGEAEQTIPTEFTAGAAPSVDDVVNVHGNNTMHNGAVIDAYLLEPDYGPFGAWLREDIGTDRTIKPFECYILAKAETTARYRVLRRGMKIDDTPTGWDDVTNSDRQTTITVYTIAGFRIAQYTDCSFAEAAKRLNTEHSEGIYILRSENESVKLMIGGK